MIRLLLATTLLAGALVQVSHVAPAQAQPASALGKPLPMPDLAPGTVSVRVVEGTPSKAVSNAEVTLVVNGTPRVARTDATGRAYFKGLPAGAKVQAKIIDEAQKEVPSEEFALPGDKGVGVMLSTRPWSSGAAGPAAGPMAGGQMPNPRAMSGEPRPEPSDAPGTFTVRLSYDDFKDAPPVDVPVALVGYAADGNVTTQVAKSDREGRAKFSGLDRTGATSYFAMTLLPRNNATDRLTSTPAVLDARAGVRLILSSEKRSSTAAAVDDLAKLERQENAPPAGKVQVVLQGGADPDAVVQLIDAEQKLVIGRGKPQSGAPDPSEVQAEANFDNKPDIPAGTLRFIVKGGSHSNEPLAGVSIRLVAASSPDAAGTDVVTPATGTVDVTTTLKEPVVAVVTINGKELRSKDLDLTQTGAQLEVTARWPARGKPEVMFDLVPRPGQVVYVETMMHGQQYRTLPFQPVPERGTRVTLFIFPRVMFTFSLTSRVDDEYLGVSGRFELSNMSWSPYVGGPDGVLVPLPRGFTGALVAEKDQGDVAVAQGEGFRIVRPIPPGAKRWHGAFSLKVKDGNVKWAMDLPFGTLESGMDILKAGRMKVETSGNVKGKEVDAPQGTYFVLPQITIMPKQSMVLSISGLPSPPAWRLWVPRIVGVVVVLLLLGGIAFALIRTKQVDTSMAERNARRQELLDELVEIEKTGKTEQNEQRREQLMAELEKLWDDAA